MMSNPQIAGVVVAGMLSLVLRIAGAAARALPFILMRLFGWILCASASAMAAIAAGAWIPIWIILLLCSGSIFAGYLEWRYNHLPAADLAFMLVALLVSHSFVEIIWMLPALAAYALVGLCADVVALRVPKWLVALVAIIPTLYLAVGLSLDAGGLSSDLGDGLMPELWKADKAFPLFLGVTVPNAGERTPLNEDVVAWTLRPKGEPEGGVLLLHGADPKGAHQRAAFVIQHTLIRSGYVVISLDHPGYGASAHPERGQPVSAWDPAPAVSAAYEQLGDELSAGTPRIVIGHSMGASDVLRLLEEKDPHYSVILGGSMPDPSERDSYWYGRFHSDRRIRWRLPREKWKTIRQIYYNNSTLVHRLSKGHSPILFVQFGIEWPNVRSQRSALWRAIPGPKRLIELDKTTHYLNSFYLNLGFLQRWDTSLLLCDVRGISRVRDLVRRAPDYSH